MDTHCQTVGMNKLETQLRFDIQGFSDFCPNVFSSTDTTDMIDEKLKNIPLTNLESQVYKFNVEECYSNWKILVNFHKGKSNKPSLGIFLKLVKSYCNTGNVKEEEVPDSINVPVYTKFKISLIASNGAVDYSRDAVRMFPSTELDDWGYEEFVQLDYIWNKKDKFFSDDILKIRIDLTILTNKVSQSVAKMHDLPIKCLTTDLSNLLKSGTGSDATVKCGAEVFLVHRTILSARSPVFNNMFKSGLSETQSNTVQIEDIRPVVFQSLLEYVYSASLSIPSLDNDQLVGLVQASDKYQLDDLKLLCFRELVFRLNLTNAGQTAVLCHLHSAEMEDKCAVFEYCSRNWITLAVQPAFQEMVKGYPAAFCGTPKPN